MNPLDLLPAVYLIAGTPIAGALLAVTVDAGLNLRDLRRTGHVSGCPAPHGWSCSCPPP